ncbi:MAG: hypothetical protein HRO68_09910 [Nitrosopumilus sp.]|nr:hypothetical protein [Nitrosopumilus sp.]
MAFSSIALIISILGVYLRYQDKPTLKIISKYCPATINLGNSYIALSIINTGKRPLVIRILGGNDKNGKWAGSFINDQKAGLRLDEKERYDIALYKDDMVEMTPDDDVIFVKLWVEDSLGKRYFVPDSKKHVSKLLNG